MEESTLGEVTARLARLEAENRRWRRAGGALAAVAAAALFMGQAAPNDRTVEARKFILRDGTGAARGEWSCSDEGPARLELLRKDGQANFLVEVHPNGLAGVSLDNGAVTKMGVSVDGSAFMVVRDRKGNQLFRTP